MKWISQVYTYIPFHPTVIQSLQVITKHWAKLPVLHSSLPLGIYFTHGNLYRSVLISQFNPSFSSLPVPTCLFFISVPLIVINAQSPSCVCIFVASLTVACQTPLPMEFSRQYSASAYSRGSPQPRDRIYVSCVIGRQILYHKRHSRSQIIHYSA